MSKCGKSCMPECEYFTTGGCISPFNCPYKIETGYINSATSTTDSLTGILMEFDEMGLLRQRRAPDPEKYAIEGRERVRKEIEHLKSENADLRERLDKAEHRAKVAERALLLMARGECTFAPPEFYKEEAEREVAEEEQIMANRCGEGKCEYFESRRRAANNNREYGYCKKYKQELHFYDWWWLKCDECIAQGCDAR